MPSQAARSILLGDLIFPSLVSIWLRADSFGHSFVIITCSVSVQVQLQPILAFIYL
jgi:hypothetical protein